MRAARALLGLDQKTLAERRNRAVDTFGKMGIPKARLLATIGKDSVEDIGLAELETLIGIHTAIREGTINIDEAFPAPAKPVFQFTPKPEPTPEPQAEINTPPVDVADMFAGKEGQ